MEQLLENVCLLLASRTRDVVKSALGFIKVAVVVMDVAHLAKHVQLVVSVPFPLCGRRRDLWAALMEPVSLKASKFQAFFYLRAVYAAEGHAGALEGTGREWQPGG